MASRGYRPRYRRGYRHKSKAQRKYAKKRYYKKAGYAAKKHERYIADRVVKKAFRYKNTTVLDRLDRRLAYDINRKVALHDRLASVRAKILSGSVASTAMDSSQGSSSGASSGLGSTEISSLTTSTGLGRSFDEILAAGKRPRV